MRADWTNGSLDLAFPGSIFHQAGPASPAPEDKGDPVRVLHARCPQRRLRGEPRGGRWGQGVPRTSQAGGPGAQVSEPSGARRPRPGSRTASASIWLSPGPPVLRAVPPASGTSCCRPHRASCPPAAPEAEFSGGNQVPPGPWRDCPRPRSGSPERGSAPASTLWRVRSWRASTLFTKARAKATGRSGRG